MHKFIFSVILFLFLIGCNYNVDAKIPNENPSSEKRKVRKKIEPKTIECKYPENQRLCRLELKLSTDQFYVAINELLNINDKRAILLIMGWHYNGKQAMAWELKAKTIPSANAFRNYPFEFFVDLRGFLSFFYHEAQEDHEGRVF